MTHDKMPRSTSQLLPTSYSTCLDLSTTLRIKMLFLPKNLTLTTQLFRCLHNYCRWILVFVDTLPNKGHGRSVLFEFGHWIRQRYHCFDCPLLIHVNSHLHPGCTYCIPRGTLITHLAQASSTLQITLG